MNDLPTYRIICAAVMNVMLFLSAVSDIRKRVIPAAFSRILLLTALCCLIYERSYMLAAYFFFAVLATGSRSLKIPLFAFAVLILANSGDDTVPFIFSLAAADLLFFFGIIGGGDAQLLFAMLAFGGRSWLMTSVIAAVTIAAGLVCVICRYGFRKAVKRLVFAAETLRTGNIDSDQDRLRISFAGFLFISFLLYLFVSLKK